MSTVREIRLPALSATMEEATLLAWKVGPGDSVTEGQAIAELSTDKVDMDLESPFAGVIEELLVEPGASVPLGAAMVRVATEADDLLGGLDLGGGGEPTPTRDAEEPVSDRPVEAGRSGGIVPAVPPARKMARDMGIDLADVTPTGSRGQIVPADVKRRAEGRAEGVPTAAPAPATPVAAPAAAPAPDPASDSTASSVPTPVDDAKRAAIRKATADVMGRSAAIPQFTLWRTLVLDRAAVRRGGASWTTVMVRALAASIRRHPEVHAVWDEATKTAVPGTEVRVGLAVDRPGVGLVVVSVDRPDGVDSDVADQVIRAAADRARTGKLRPEDMAPAAVTLSNLGGLGVDRFNALLFPPQAVILSAGTIRMRPVATGDGALKAALTCEVGLTVDHRVADGADGARFLDTFAHLVEDPA